MSVIGFVDAPDDEELVYQHGFQMRGWARTGDARPWSAVVAQIGAATVGSTRLPLPRPDVASNLGQATADVGFVLRCVIPEALRFPGVAEVALHVIDADGATLPFTTLRVRLSEIDYRIHSASEVVTDRPPRVLTRDEIYMSGPPSAVADPVCTELLVQYLRRGDRVLDVGCGVGAYFHTLSPFGIEWAGCEAEPALVDAMKTAGLNSVLAGSTLPFPDASFDASICIEVLEHIDDYEPFLAEIARVSRRSALFSVPNFGAVPITSSIYALPFHMLEPDHKNFFTARSLEALLARYFRHVEAFEYGPLALLQSHDGIAIHNHVFAVALH